MARRPATDPGEPDDGGDVDVDVDGLSYRDAVDELDAILTELEDDDVDVDLLSMRVRRAAALIRFCQERIAGARLEVEHVVADLTLAPAADGNSVDERALDGNRDEDGDGVDQDG